MDRGRPARAGRGYDNEEQLTLRLVLGPPLTLNSPKWYANALGQQPRVISKTDGKGNADLAEQVHAQILVQRVAYFSFGFTGCHVCPATRGANHR